MVTGGAGRLGNVLVRELIKRNHEVNVLLLPGARHESIDGLGAKIIEGNILDYEGLKKSFKGMEVVYHLAAMISIVQYDKDKVFKVNIEGTDNVINACIINNAKMVYVSTIHALDEHKKEVIDEDVGFNEKTNRGNYDKSKAISSNKVIKAVKEKGLKAIIVCPTGIIGPYDYEVSFFSKYIAEYVNKKLFFYIDGSYDFVDVRDVAKGMADLVDNGNRGRWSCFLAIKRA
jgi:dihydroflavonol-4-reductase